MIEKTGFGDPTGGFGPLALNHCSSDCNSQHSCGWIACLLNYGNNQATLDLINRISRFETLNI